RRKPYRASKRFAYGRLIPSHTKNTNTSHQRVELREGCLVKTRSRRKHCRIAAGSNGTGRVETRIEPGTRATKAGPAIDKAHDNLVANAVLHGSHRKQIKRIHVERTGGGKNVDGELFEYI